MTPTSEAFRRWFGNSVVVDLWNRPREVYHGSRGIFSVFDPYKSERPTWNGFGSWFSADSGYAAKFAGPEGKVYAVYLSIQNPLKLQGDGPRGWGKLVELYTKLTGVKTHQPTHETNRVFEAYLRSKGYDGVVLKNFKGDMGLRPYPQDFYIALSPTQVKSASWKQTTYDPNDPDYLHGLRQARALIAQVDKARGPGVVRGRF
jgi:hypothetical protein